MVEAVVTLVTSEENTDEATKAYMPRCTITKVYRLEFENEDRFNKWLADANMSDGVYSSWPPNS